MGRPWQYLRGRKTPSQLTLLPPTRRCPSSHHSPLMSQLTPLPPLHPAVPAPATNSNAQEILSQATKPNPAQIPELRKP